MTPDSSLPVTDGRPFRVIENLLSIVFFLGLAIVVMANSGLNKDQSGLV
jgi:hypothetical protein